MIRVGKQHFADLRNIRLGVCVDRFPRKHWAKLISSGWIAHTGSVVADYDDGFVPPFLELADDHHRHAMAQRDVGSSRVQANLDSKLSPRCELFSQVPFTQDPLGAPRENPNLLIDADGHGEIVETWLSRATLSRVEKPAHRRQVENRMHKYRYPEIVRALV